MWSYILKTLSPYLVRLEYLSHVLEKVFGVLDLVSMYIKGFVWTTKMTV